MNCGQCYPQIDNKMWITLRKLKLKGKKIMYIKKVTLNNFRNYENQEIDFGNNINIIYGDNAQGKTNIIESIFLCAYR